MLALILVTNILDTAIIVAIGLAMLLSTSRPIAGVLSVAALTLKFGTSTSIEFSITGFVLALMISLWTFIMVIGISTSLAVGYLAISVINTSMFLITQSLTSFMTFLVITTGYATFTLYLLLTVIRCDDQVVTINSIILKPLVLFLVWKYDVTLHFGLTLIGLLSFVLVANIIPSNESFMLSGILTFSFGTAAINDFYDISLLAAIVVSVSIAVIFVSTKVSFVTALFVIGFAIGIPCCMVAVLKLILSAASDLFVVSAYVANVLVV